MYELNIELRVWVCQMSPFHVTFDNDVKQTQMINLQGLQKWLQNATKWSQCGALDCSERKILY